MQLTLILQSGSHTDRYLTQNFIRVMRLTAILLLTASLHAAARSDGQTVTLHVKDVPVKAVFRKNSKGKRVSIS